MTLAAEPTPVAALRSSRRALRAERARVGHWRRLIQARLDLALAAAAVPEPLGFDPSLVLDAAHRVAPPRCAELVRALRWSLPLGEVHHLPELQRLLGELTQYQQSLDLALDETTEQFIDQLSRDPAAVLVGAQATPTLH